MLTRLECSSSKFTGLGQRPMVKRFMDDARTDTHPYSLEVGPSAFGKNFQWTIRMHGKVFQRSDKQIFVKSKARADGMAMIERLLTQHSIKFALPQVSSRPCPNRNSSLMRRGIFVLVPGKSGQRWPDKSKTPFHN